MQRGGAFSGRISVSNNDPAASSSHNFEQPPSAVRVLTSNPKAHIEGSSNSSNNARVQSEPLRARPRKLMRPEGQAVSAAAVLSAAKTAEAAGGGTKKIMPSLSIFDTSNPTSVLNLAFPSVVVLRHLPNTVRIADVIDFFEGLKLLDEDKCIWTIPSSITGKELPDGSTRSQRQCSCVCCVESADYFGDRYDICVHLSCHSGKTLAVQRSGEKISIADYSESAARGAELQSGKRKREKLIQISVQIESISEEEQCWLYVLGLNLLRPLDSPFKLYSALSKYPPEADRVKQSIIDVSRYWTSQNFKLNSYANVVQRAVRFVRYYSVHNDDSKVQSTRMKRKNNTKVKAASMSFPNWISRKYCQPFTDGSVVYNRLLNVDDVCSRAIGVKSVHPCNVKSGGDRNAKSSSRATLQNTSYISGCQRKLQLHLSYLQIMRLGVSTKLRQSAAISEAASSPAPINVEDLLLETSALDIALDYTDRVLYLFNIIHMWTSEMEVEFFNYGTLCHEKET